MDDRFFFDFWYLYLPHIYHSAAGHIHEKGADKRETDIPETSHLGPQEWLKDTVSNVSPLEVSVMIGGCTVRVHHYVKYVESKGDRGSWSIDSDVQKEQFEQ